MAPPMMFVHESASLRLAPKEGWFYLHSLYSTVPGHGHASALMDLTVQYADDNGIILVLEVGQYGHTHGLDNVQLKAFYERKGFESAGGRFMRRKPRKNPILGETDELDQ